MPQSLLVSQLKVPWPWSEAMAGMHAMQRMRCWRRWVQGRLPTSCMPAACSSDLLGIIARYAESMSGHGEMTFTTRASLAAGRQQVSMIRAGTCGRSCLAEMEGSKLASA